MSMVQSYLDIQTPLNMNNLIFKQEKNLGFASIFKLASIFEQPWGGHFGSFPSNLDSPAARGYTAAELSHFFLRQEPWS